MNETVEVIVPYWGTDPHRRASLKWVTGMLTAQGLPTTVARRRKSVPKAAALWPAIKRSDADILVLHDADCWCDGLTESIETIASGEFVWGRPHRDVVRLSEASTAFYCEHHALPNRREISYDRTPYKGVTGGGVVIARTEVLLDCAMDPRFDGWGQEDMALGNAIWTLYGPPLIGDADLIHLYHEPAPRIDHMWGTEANKTLYTRYHHATTDRSEMLQLVAEAHQALEAVA